VTRRPDPDPANPAARPDSRAAARLATLIAVPVAVAAGVVAFLLLGRAPDATPPPPATTAPAGPVRMAAPPLDADARAACRDLVTELPAAVRGLPRRPVTAGPEQNAAYGEPPVTLACGGPPPSYGPTDDFWLLSAVCWHTTAGPAGTVWAALDRTVPVRVTVPAAYDPPGQWVIAFSTPVTAALAPSDAAPSGCRPLPSS
jgi:hypothetical protein